MPTPRNDTYSALSGVTIYGGLSAPPAAPAWMRNAVIGQWVALPNSIGAGGADVDNYSGFILDDNLTVWIAAAGGHQNFDNRVVKYDASVDTPTGWQTVVSSVSSAVDNAAYNANGSPAARHTYDWQFFDPATRRLFLVGAYGVYSQAVGWNTIDAFNIDTGTWDAAGTWPYTYGTSPANGGAGNDAAFMDTDTGTLFWGTRRWKPSVGGQPTDLGAFSTPVKMTNVYDPSRQAVFGVQWGNGWISGTGITASQTLNPSGSQTKRTISFNSSAALTAFQNDGPGNAAITYDSIRDKYAFAYGSTTSVGYSISGPLKIIEITPSSGTTWDMSIVTQGGANPGNVADPSGLCGRFKYVKKDGIGGYLVMTNKASGLYFYRTA